MRDEIMRLADEYDKRAPRADVEGQTSVGDAWMIAARELRALARTDHAEDKLGMAAADIVEAVGERVGMSHGGWDMVNPADLCRAFFAEFEKLTDTGNPVSEQIQQVAPDHSAGVGGMVAKVSAPDGWEFTEGGGVTEVFDIAQWPDIGGIWRDDETGLPVLHAEGDLKDWPSGKINAVLVQVNRAQPADAGADGGK